ncbi:helix-turn-helix transcriptional regulator [Salmonella enterica subsp. enterica serovar Enteritidis]|nr:helix-turn-helix transcriptional regulator [Salmonella enterica subsp. enterica serovar Enteritidis]EGT9239892.1 helix-turn-helix transcriptional regulator [Salmonella enterica]
MFKKKELLTAHREGLDEWGRIIRKELGFADAKISTPKGMASDQFFGHMCIDELSNETLLIGVNSSSQQTNLVHNDFYTGVKNKIFIVNACNSLLVKNNENRCILSPGDSIVIPAWHGHIEESFSGRTSTSIIMNISCFTDSIVSLNKILWKKISSLKYGFEINRIISNYYSNKSSRFCEKNNLALISLLSLEVELSHFETDFMTKQKKISSGSRTSIIINYIKDNIKNPNLNLSMVANYLGLTERMVQYILSEKGIRFHQLLTEERCGFLASKIKHDLLYDVNIKIFESGFESISTACRQFKKIYGITPRQYQVRLIKRLNSSSS